MLYGTIKKYRAGESVKEIELHTEYVEVSTEAEALGEFIKFVRDTQDNKYQEPCMRLLLRGDGTIKRIVKEYNVLVDE